MKSLEETSREESRAGIIFGSAEILREELGRNFYEELELEKVTVRAEIMRRE